MARRVRRPTDTRSTTAVSTAVPDLVADLSHVESLQRSLHHLLRDLSNKHPKEAQPLLGAARLIEMATAKLDGRIHDVLAEHDRVVTERDDLALRVTHSRAEAAATNIELERTKSSKPSSRKRKSTDGSDGDDVFARAQEYLDRKLQKKPREAS